MALSAGGRVGLELNPL